MGIMDTEKIYEGLGISREVWEYGQRTESRLKELIASTFSFLNLPEQSRSLTV